MRLASANLLIISFAMVSGLVACKSADDYKYTPPKIEKIDTDKLIADLEKDRKSIDVDGIQDLVDSINESTKKYFRQLQLEELGKDHEIIVPINDDRTSMNRSAKDLKTKNDLYKKTYEFATNVMGLTTDTEKDQFANEMSEKSAPYLLVYMATYGLLKVELGIDEHESLNEEADKQASKDKAIEKFAVFKQAILFILKWANENDSEKTINFANTMSDIEENSDIYMATYHDAYKYASVELGFVSLERRAAFSENMAERSIFSLNNYKTAYSFAGNERDMSDPDDKRKFANGMLDKGRAYLNDYIAAYKFARDTRGITDDSKRDEFARDQADKAEAQRKEEDSQ